MSLLEIAGSIANCLAVAMIRIKWLIRVRTCALV